MNNNSLVRNYYDLIDSYIGTKLWIKGRIIDDLGNHEDLTHDVAMLSEGAWYWVLPMESGLIRLQDSEREVYVPAGYFSAYNIAESSNSPPIDPKPIDLVVDEAFPVELAMLIDSRTKMNDKQIFWDNYRFDPNTGAKNTFTLYLRAVFEGMTNHLDNWEYDWVSIKRCGKHNSLTNVPDGIIISIVEFYYAASEVEGTIRVYKDRIVVEGYRA